MERSEATGRFFQELRAREFALLDARGLAYLDYTGAAIPAASQLAAHDALVRSAVFGNPHAEHGPSRASTEAIERARALVLRFVDADPDEYAVCFTANASAAIKLVAESFRYGERGVLALSADNHNSVNGMREYARRARARVVTLPLTPDLRLDRPTAHLRRATIRGSGGQALFAFPAQSNFSGVRHSLSLVDEAQRLGVAVLLDAAAFVPSCPLSLRRVHPEFMALSFYKVFGFPTGVGALVARRDALGRLERPWFAGGTVDWVSVRHQRHRLRPTAEAFEDGTPHYHGIAALAPGFEFIERVGVDRIGAHVSGLVDLLLRELRGQRHRDGRPVFRLHGPADGSGRGGAVAFNLLDDRGRFVPYETVEARAREARIAVRGGCFCNPGASEAAFGFPPSDTLSCLEAASARGFTPRRFAECLGNEGGIAVGAIRASVGVATSPEDVRRAVRTLAEIALEPVSSAA
jgi:selenocysteine lyase/cysteine desulfurase